MSVQAFHHFAPAGTHPLVAQIDAVLMPRAEARLNRAIDASVAAPSHQADVTAAAAVKAIVDLQALRRRFEGIHL